MEVLQTCRDPEIEDKILDAVNSPAMNAAIVPLLRKFLEEFRPAKPDGRETDSAWAQRARAARLNRLYLSAAALFEQGKLKEAAQALEEVLKADPGYPFAIMLKRLT
jgi:tetratricopeptide (TPR) repeat protein